MNAADAVLSPAIAAGRGDEIALLHGEAALTYAELLDMVNRIGNGLRSHGVEPENRVLLMLEDSPELAAAYLGVMKIGAVAVALDARCAPAELRFAIDDSRCKFLILGEEFLPRYRDIASELLAAPRLIVVGRPASGFPTLGIFTATQSPVLRSLPMSPDDMAFWIYTSGTTGTPKAAVHLQHDLLFADRYLRDVLGVAAGDRLFSTTKLFFAYALGTCLFGALRCGATTILRDGPFDAAHFASVVDRHRPSIVLSIPTHYQRLLQEASGEFRPSFAAVRHYVSSGERLPIGLADRWEAWSGRPILETLGTSESLCMILANAPGRHRYGSCGFPAPGVEVRLTDGEGQKIAGPDDMGQLWVAMPSMADRYWNQQHRSQEAFSGRWLCTGDLFSVDRDGFWYHEGRADDMLKIAGQWVSPTEVEAVAMAVPGVADAAAIVLRQDEGLPRICLFAVPAGGSGARTLRRRIEARMAASLAAHKRPHEIRFVDQVPRTATGKIQRYRLREAVL